MQKLRGLADPERWRPFMTRRYCTLYAGVLTLLVSGTLYGLSAYTPALKDQLHFSQGEITLIATFGNIGLYVGFLMGKLYDTLGVKWTCAVAGTMVCGGYFCAWIVVAGHIDAGYWWLMAIFYLIIGQGNWGLYLATLTVNMRNFDKEDRGKVAGLLAAAFGLSSGMFTLIYAVFFSETDNVAGYILFTAIVVALAVIVAVLVMRPEVPVAPPAADPEKVAEEEEKISIIQSRDEEVPGLGAKTEQPGTLATLDFYLVFVPFIFAAGAGLLVINNLGEVVRSLDGGSLEKNLYVAGLSVLGCIGRFTVGSLSDRLVKKGVTRAYWLVLCLIMFAISHLAFWIFTERWMIPFVALITGLAYGGFFAVVPILISLYFGFTHFGKNNSCAALAPAIGSFGFNNLASMFYDRNKEGDAEHCFGGDCWSTIFMVTGFLCVVGAGITFFLAWRRKHFLQ
ncbi:transporter, major facilitator subfamily protein [Acanthamoeba castellanii str. Neff]|uniref:Transporter, major facilitator subfamily protein n=1 Tax=Acanthamoeba castellanii (strain ATCC 30010 / Neff) TaxID=1257118 RepID=L8H7K9_ACACF|nr:transporter, major facilitator subfamily protein [Acanthamoeba castellanii str. Neff]ELR21222.1 transporter, major facilitator subfamily protein [Acanthamoeba castellanii str. Neff]